MLQRRKKVGCHNYFLMSIPTIKYYTVLNDKHCCMTYNQNTLTIDEAYFEANYNVIVANQLTIFIAAMYIIYMLPGLRKSTISECKLHLVI